MHAKLNGKMETSFELPLQFSYLYLTLTITVLQKPKQSLKRRNFFILPVSVQSVHCRGEGKSGLVETIGEI